MTDREYLAEAREWLSHIKCPTCNGSGSVEVFDDYVGEPVPIICPDCGGSGVSDD